MSKNVIQQVHGTGGRSTHELVDRVFRPYLKNDLLSPHDAAEVRLGSDKLIVTTDAHVVEPIIFPGGDIGKLSVTGVINDLLTRGGKPLYLSLGFILEEGLEISDLERVLASLSTVLRENGVRLLCADTKVVPSRGQPGLMIASTLFGEPISNEFKFAGVRPGDTLIVSGPLGSHGLALMQAREKLPFKGNLVSDCASLYPLFAPLIEKRERVHYLRDITRGGLGGILHELARQFEVSFEIEEESIPVLPEVRAGLKFLGLDPLEVANEGVMLSAVASDRADAVLEFLKQHALGRHAAIIGRATPALGVPAILRTPVGGKRVLPWPEALNLPRIC